MRKFFQIMALIITVSYGNGTIFPMPMGNGLYTMIPLKILTGGINLTIKNFSHTSNIAKVHISTNINEAKYLYDNNQLISVSEGTIKNGYIMLRSGKHRIKVCFDRAKSLCSFEEEITIWNTVAEDNFVQYEIGYEIGALTNDGHKLIYSTRNGTIYSLNVNSDTSSYMYVLPDTSGSIYNHISGLAFLNNDVYYYSKNRKNSIYTINIKTTANQYLVADDFPDGLDIYRGNVYAVAGDRNPVLNIFDLSGKKIGSLNTHIPDITGITHSSRYLYILSENGNIYQVNPVNGDSHKIFNNQNLFTTGNNFYGLEAITILNNYIYVSYIDDKSIYRININIKDYE